MKVGHSKKHHFENFKRDYVLTSLFVSENEVHPLVNLTWDELWLQSLTVDPDELVGRGRPGRELNVTHSRPVLLTHNHVWSPTQFSAGGRQGGGGKGDPPPTLLLRKDRCLRAHLIFTTFSWELLINDHSCRVHPFRSRRTRRWIWGWTWAWIYGRTNVLTCESRAELFV